MTNNPLHSLRRASHHEDEGAPVVLPHLVIHASDSGELTVTVDGEPVDPPPTGMWTRSRFGDLLDLVTDTRTVAVRVEVHESDGSTFTDLVHAQRRRTPPSAEAPPKPSGKHTARRRPGPVEVTGEGFVAGEQVAVAVITTTTTATATGQASAAIKPKDAPAGEVVLIGRVSGTVCVRRLP